VEAIVCAQDSFCCNTSWDNQCAAEAVTLAGQTCCGPFGARMQLDAEIDITETGAVLGSGDDEGFLVNLGGAPFFFYGASFSTVLVSTNGYIAMNTLDAPGDTTNSCPLPGGDPGPRIIALHDDLFATAVFHQYFPNCPRTHDAFPGQGCDVIQWQATYFFMPGPLFNFEAILYDGSFDVAFVYGPDYVDNTSSTIGIQSPPQALQWGCNVGGLVAPSTAICVYDTGFCLQP
jgi:hypothetical protein